MIKTIKLAHCDGVLCPRSIVTNTGSYTLAVELLRDRGWLVKLDGQWCPQCRDAQAREDALHDGKTGTSAEPRSASYPSPRWHPEIPEPDRDDVGHGVAPEVVARAELHAVAADRGRAS